jgi:PTS system arbutin-like IIC component
VFVALGLLETATMYLVGTFCITRLRLLTPGREAAADEHSQRLIASIRIKARW